MFFQHEGDEYKNTEGDEEDPLPSVSLQPAAPASVLLPPATPPATNSAEETGKNTHANGHR